jgi:large subunit ribosomal protein L31e
MERTYIIPLRKEWLKVPLYKRAKKAVSATRQFLVKHMKTPNVKLGRHLNMALWTNGVRNPPHKIEVHVEMVKDAEGDYAYAELSGKDKEILKQIKVEKKEGFAGKLDDIVTGAKDVPQPKTLAEQKAMEKKEAEKVEKEKPLKKEASKPIVGKDKIADAKKEVQQKTAQEKIVSKDDKKNTPKKE